MTDVPTAFNIHLKNLGNKVGEDANSGGHWHLPLAFSNGKEVLDFSAGVLSHPATSAGLQYGDDILRAIGIAKAIPGLNIMVNAAGAYVVTNDLSSADLSTGRKIYRTTANGVPLVFSVGAMVGAFGAGAGEGAVIIGAVDYVGELTYDHVIMPSIRAASEFSYKMETWYQSMMLNNAIAP